MLTLGVSLMVGAGTMTKYVNDAPVIVRELWQVLGIPKSQTVPEGSTVAEINEMLLDNDMDAKIDANEKALDNNNNNSSNNENASNDLQEDEFQEDKDDLEIDDDASSFSSSRKHDDQAKSINAFTNSIDALSESFEKDFGNSGTAAAPVKQSDPSSSNETTPPDESSLTLLTHPVSSAIVNG